MIADKNYQEKRSHPRVTSNVPVKIVQEDGDIVTETKNISRAGAYCKVDKYIEPMTKLKVNLLVPGTKGSGSTGKKISCEGVVVRVEPLPEDDVYNIAIFFNDLSQRDSELLGEYVSVQLDE